MKHNFRKTGHPVPQSSYKTPGLFASSVPLILMLAVLLTIVICGGASHISEWSPYILIGSALISVIISFWCGCISRRGIKLGFVRSARQILPAVPMLMCIAMIAATWMLSGVVPLLISFGVSSLSPVFFLLICSVVCGFISVLTGSSWSTIATIGVAFMGIGSVMGYHPGIVAGAVISGAYFGDKVSPLSDTTVISASSCGVDLFTHIRYMMLTTFPAMLISLLLYLCIGLMSGGMEEGDSAEMMSMLNQYFNLSPWLLVIPAVTFALVALRVNTLLTLFTSSMLGFAAIFIFQPQIVANFCDGSFIGYLSLAYQVLWGEVGFETSSEFFNNLVSTSGISGMFSTICLVLSAMLFGMVMIGTGMLSSITKAITGRINKRVSLVSSTAASGLILNSCTADQYLSIIVGSNMFRNAYRRCGLESRLLSRTLEDSVSVTSVLIPWNSCGVTQSAVLGVSTLVYLPFCFFNILSPLMTILISVTGFKIKQRVISQPAVVSV